MPNLSGILDHIKSVKSTQQITRAVRQVAAARVYRARNQVVSGRPFADRLVVLLFWLLAQLRFEDIDLPLLKIREVKSVAVVVIAADSGLCGAYNADIIRHTMQLVHQLQEEGKTIRLHLIGNMAISAFRDSDFQIAATFPDIGQEPSAAQAGEIVDAMVAPFLTGEVDKVELIYTRFISLLSGKVTTQTLLPLDLTALTQDDETSQLITQDGDFKVSSEGSTVQTQPKFAPDTIFEQKPAQLLDTLLPLYLNGQTFRALQSAIASELAARITAMTAAYDNADDLLKTLTLAYNKARQEAITEGALEVVSGSL